MREERSRLSMGHSPRLSCPPVEEWGLLPQSPSRGWHRSWLRSLTPQLHDAKCNQVQAVLFPCGFCNHVHQRSTIIPQKTSSILLFSSVD